MPCEWRYMETNGSSRRKAELRWKEGYVSWFLGCERAGNYLSVSEIQTVDDEDSSQRQYR